MSAAVITNVFKQFRPYEPLAADSPVYVETRAARGIDGLVNTTVLQAATAGRGALFLAGAVGDGKSTLLHRLRLDLQAYDAFVVSIEAPDVLAARDVSVSDLVVAILAAILSTLPEALPGSGGAIGKIRQQWSNLWAELRRLGSLPVELESIEGGLKDAIKLVAKIRDSPNARLQLRTCFERAETPTLLALLNGVLEAIRDGLEKAGRGSLVVILDSLDRLFTAAPNLGPEETLFVNGAAFLGELECVTLYTARLTFVQEHYQTLGITYGNAPLLIPLVRVRERDGTVDEGGIAVLRKVVERRVDAGGSTLAAVFGPDPDGTRRLDKLCLQSGGHLRTLMMLVQNALGSAAGKLPLTDQALDEGIRNLSAPLRLAAGSHAAALQEVRASQSLDRLAPDVRSLVQSRWWVYRYRDDACDWYGVNPLCE